MDAQRRIAELTTLNQVAATLNESADLDTALRAALQALVRQMGLATGWIFLGDPAAPAGPARLMLAADFQLPPGLAADHCSRLTSDGCACQDLFDSGRFARSVNILECSRIEDALEEGGDVAGLRVHASVPIRARDRIIGILNVASPQIHHFSHQDLQLMTAVGNQMGMAVERARLYDLVRSQRIREHVALLQLSNALLSLNDLQAVVDQVVRFVAEALGADASALVLCDASGSLQFRAGVGWDTSTFTGEPPHLTLDTPAGRAFRSGQPVQVDQADLEPSAQPAGPIDAQGAARSVLAVPVSQSGRSIGALVVHARAQHRFSEEDVRLLQLMANQAAIAIETARLQDRAIAEERLRKELEVAHQIQAALLPEHLPDIAGWDFGAYYASAREVGGDFYDLIVLPGHDGRPAAQPGGRLALTIADVSDKGVPAALIMTLCRTLVRAAALGGHGPAEAIRRVNSLILPDNRTEQFITLFYAELDPASGRLRFVNAGHNPPLWARDGAQEVHTLRPHGMPLGLFDPIELDEGEVQLAPGDVLLLYTDGATEALNSAGAEFGSERLARLVADNRSATAGDVVHRIAGALRDFVGDAEPFDDVTLMAIKRLA